MYDELRQTFLSALLWELLFLINSYLNLTNYMSFSNRVKLKSTAKEKFSKQQKSYLDDCRYCHCHVENLCDLTGTKLFTSLS